MGLPKANFCNWLCVGAGGWIFFLGLICYLVLSCWSVCYEFAYNELWRQGSQDFILVKPRARASARAGALTILVGLGVVRTQVIVSWLVARLRKPRSRQCSWKAVMQSDLHTQSGFSPDTPADRSRRARYCKHVHSSRGCFDGARPLADRVYHVTEIGKKCEKDQKMRGVHLPLYDHYCHWIGVIVWLETIKPYLLCLIFLLIDILIVIASSIAAMALSTRTSALLHAPTLLLASFVTFWLAQNNARFKLKTLAIENITMPEWNQVNAGGGGFWFAIATDDSGQDGFFRYYEGNPWDLGIRSNIHQVFGGLLGCLLPWTQPPRVRRYADRTLVSDFEMSADFWDWVAECRREHMSLAAGRSPVVLDQRPEDLATRPSTDAGTSMPPPVLHL